MFYGYDPHPARDQVHRIREISDRMLREEALLIEELIPFAEQRRFVRFGYKSLRTFCVTGLQLTKTQSQRIATRVKLASLALDVAENAATKNFAMVGSSPPQIDR